MSGKDADGNLINADKLGLIYEFPATKLTGNAGATKKRNVGRPIRAIALRNESGFALLGKRVVRLTRTAGYSLLTSADGYAAAYATTLVAIVDPNITSVADDDIFWGILQGPVTVVTTNTDTDFYGDIAVGSPIVAATGSTSGNSTCGRVCNVTINSSTANTEPFTAALALLGYAMSAKTTANTGADLLINACIRL